MEEKERKSNEELIKDLTDKIISNSKDAKWAKEMLGQLKGLLSMDKLIDISLKDIKGTIDFGANRLYRTVAGFIWECKGGLTTFVDYRMFRVYTMLNTLFDLHNKEDKTEDENTIYDAFSTAIQYTFQTPIFASMNEESLYGIATDILKRFNEYTTEHYTNAEAVDETEEDIKANVVTGQAATAMEILAESPLPPEDSEDI